MIYAAWVAKQFTAFLAALLVTEGRWTAADQIRAMVPELPSWADDGIEVQHLVHQLVRPAKHAADAQERRGVVGRLGQY